MSTPWRPAATSFGACPFTRPWSRGSGATARGPPGAENPAGSRIGRLRDRNGLTAPRLELGAVLLHVVGPADAVPPAELGDTERIVVPAGGRGRGCRVDDGAAVHGGTPAEGSEPLRGIRVSARAHISTPRPRGAGPPSGGLSFRG